MIVGNPQVFAIESCITRAFERLSLRALGFFVIHVGGHRYGVYEPEGTMLACSLDEVRNRIAHRGTHTAPFAAELDAGKIADAFLNNVFADEPEDSVFGIPQPEFRHLMYANDLAWAPDGDEAFDDGSHVLQFDIAGRVRLIAFKCDKGYYHDPATLRDVWLATDEFYHVLREWQDAFEAEWAALPKIPTGSGTEGGNKNKQTR